MLIQIISKWSAIMIILIIMVIILIKNLRKIKEKHLERQ